MEGKLYVIKCTIFILDHMYWISSCPHTH